MTRTGDETIPAYTPADHVPTAVAASHLHVLLERLPYDAYYWDHPDEQTIVWDHPDLVWDSPLIAGGFTDAVCDFIVVSIESGAPDEDGLVESAMCTVTLDNRSGKYSQRDANGRLTYWALGRRVIILGDADGASWWIFSGRVVTWTENTDGTVTIVSHDGFAQLAQEVTTSWTPGTNGQNVAQRITSICTQWGYTGPLDLEGTGQALANPVTKRSPLEEIQVAALSDGGFVFCDSDGSLMYRGRAYTGGRVDQAGNFYTFSDNFCEALVVWELTMMTDDDGIASSVRLSNWEATPKTAVATLAPLPWDRGFVATHADPDLWTAQVDGDLLAQDLLARLSNDTPRFSFLLYLEDPQQSLWRAGLNLRLGDKINIIRYQPSSDPGQEQWLDVDLLVATLNHEITPDSWQVTVETSRVMTYRYPELWDRTGLVWDSSDALAVWRL